MTAWRKQHSSTWVRPKASVANPFYTNQIGYLCKPPGWVEWDFADLGTRQSVAKGLIDSIRTYAYPLFQAFAGPTDGIVSLAQQGLPSPEGVLGYLVAEGQLSSATDALNRYLDARPDFRAMFDTFRQQFERDGLPPFRASTPHNLAAFAVATGFPWRDR